MVEFDVKVAGARALSVHYDNAPALVSSTAFSTMRRVVLRLADYVVRNKLTGDPLDSHTRNLARSVFSRVELDGRDAVGRVGYDLAKARYGRVQELGGVITPKRAKNLTIPVGAAKTAGGAQRFGAREFIEKTRKGGGGMYGFTRSFVNKNKTAILGVKPSGAVEAVFLLRKRVELPDRPALKESLNENLPDIRRQLANDIGNALNREAS
jgi:hypothetical protein